MVGVVKVFASDLFASDLFASDLLSNDLHLAIKYLEMHHFEDDTNLLKFHICVRNMKKQVNYEHKNLSYLLRANKISPNICKSGLVFFTSSKKQKESDLKIKLNEKRLYENSLFQHLGIEHDKNLLCKQQISHVAINVNKIKLAL